MEPRDGEAGRRGGRGMEGRERSSELIFVVSSLAPLLSQAPSDSPGNLTISLLYLKSSKGFSYLLGIKFEFLSLSHKAHPDSQVLSLLSRTKDAVVSFPYTKLLIILGHAMPPLSGLWQRLLSVP